MRQFLAAILLLVLLEQSLGQIKVDPENSLLIDQYNRYRVFHGVNVVYKVDPFYPPNLYNFDPQNSFCEQDASDLAIWGFNVIRLDVAWEGFEPVKDNYNYTYLDQIMTIVRLCKKYDISVFLDAHQDVLSKLFCGEGWPDWAVTNKTFPYPNKAKLRRDAQGYPLYEDCIKVPFFHFYFSDDVGQSSQDLVTNVNNLADQFAAFWGKVADYFKNEDNIIGLEILNEPFGISNHDHFFDWVWPGLQNNKYLLPFYRKVNAQIRNVNDDILVFYEPALFDVLGGGFSENVGGKDYQNREVFSIHIYCGIQNNQGEPKWKPMCVFVDNLFFSTKTHNAKSIKVGAFLTEYGASGNTKKAIDEGFYVGNKADESFISWTYWQFKQYQDVTTQTDRDAEGFYDENGKFQVDKVKMLSRPYAYAICGKPITHKFDRDSQEYLLEVEKLDNDNCMGFNTEISLNQLFYYEDGFNYSFKNCDECTLVQSPDWQYRYQIQGMQNVQKGVKVTLTIKPK